LTIAKTGKARNRIADAARRIVSFLMLLFLHVEHEVFGHKSPLYSVNAINAPGNVRRLNAETSRIWLRRVVLRSGVSRKFALNLAQISALFCREEIEIHRQVRWHVRCEPGWINQSSRG